MELLTAATLNYGTPATVSRKLETALDIIKNDSSLVSVYLDA